MDPVSHAVVGRLLTTAVAGHASASRGSAAASILGALSPDVDFVLMPVGWDVYLRAHAIGTHSIAGALITGLGSAALVRVCASGSTFGRLAAAALLGSASHLAADIVSGARLRPGWPLFDTMPSLPLVAMGDPWVIAILAAGAVTLWRAKERKRRVARQVLAVFMAFLALKGALLFSAVQTLSGDANARYRVIEARWASLDEWLVFDRTPEAVRERTVKAGEDAPTLLVSQTLERETALVTASRSLETVRNFLQVHELAFASDQPAGGDRRAVLWSDIRYCWHPGGSGPIACALWFGGIFETNGRVVTQQVRVGSWVQNRPPPPPD
jgi:membrane-bound metal-dependent hydrolase YbcI (DUF457 family)